MSSCQLFHGPGARQAALDKAKKIGRLIAPPFGDDGLSVGRSKPSDPPGAREIVELLLSVPVGEEIGVVVIGPVDNAKSLKAMDALLKSIEEIPSPYMQPILWAEDLGGVISTIRSRCLETWAPGSTAENPELLKLARLIVDNVLANRFYSLPSDIASLKTLKEGSDIAPETLEDDDPKKTRFKGGDLLEAIADILAENLEDPNRRLFWERIRKVARYRNPTQVEIVAALVNT